MTDERDEREQERRRTRQRRSDAQGAASDLARMGIDPRSLGLDAPRTDAPEHRWGAHEPPPAAPPGNGSDQRGGQRTDQGAGQAPAPGAPQQPYPAASAFSDDNVVALRPEWGGRSPAPPPTPPAAWAGGPDTQSPAPGAGPAVGGSLARTDRTAAERMLASTLPPEAPRPSAAPAVRRAAKGLVTLDAAAAADDERALVARVRRRQAMRRLVAFVAAQGGVGTTTIATGVATVFAALRDDRSALVDVQPGTPPLSALHGVAVPGTLRQLLAEADPEAMSLPTAPSGFTLLDGPSWDRPLERSDIGGVVERLATDHTFVLADAGDDASDGAYATATRCDQAVVVAGPGEIGLHSLETALTRLERVNPAAARRAVVVLVCQRDGAQAEALQRVRDLGQDASTVVVAADPALAGGRPFRPEQVTAATRTAMLQIAASIADA